MPFFSFTLKSFIKKDIIDNLDEDTKNIVKVLKKNSKYFSKNTKLWKFLNKNIIKIYLKDLSFEKRIKVSHLKKNILFCLPPNLGLGDVVEYGLAISSIRKSNIFSKIGICFVGKYEIILKKYFQLKNIFPEFIDEKKYFSYETIFHVTLEIQQLTYQKFIRSDIEENLIRYFDVKKLRLVSKKKKNITRITIFPNSNSPIRTMTNKILQNLIINFNLDYDLEIILDKNNNNLLDVINKLEDKRNLKIIYPESLTNLLSIISTTEFGIFMDSGPLHVAKILNIPGVLIENTVSSEILLNEFYSIKVFKNNYSSDFCSAPCGLTNIINYKNKCGCFDSMKIKKIQSYDHLNLNSLQRGNLKIFYSNFIDNPVNCLKHLNAFELNKFITKVIIE